MSKIEKQIIDLDDRMLDLTYERVRLGRSPKDQERWEAIMAEIESLRNEQKKLEKELDNSITF